MSVKPITRTAALEGMHHWKDLYDSLTESHKKANADLAAMVADRDRWKDIAEGADRLCTVAALEDAQAAARERRK